MAYAILVIWANGEEEYVKQGVGASVALFPSRARAKDQAEFIKMGMDDDEVQSVNAVRAPRVAVRQPATPRRATKDATNSPAAPDTGRA